MNHNKITQRFTEVPLEKDGTIDPDFSSIAEKITGYLFRQVNLDNESIDLIKKYSDNGTVIFASYHSSNLALLIFNNVLKKNNLDSPVFALESSPVLLQPLINVFERIISQMLKWMLRERTRYILDTDHVENLVRGKKTIYLSVLSRRFFIKRYTNVKHDSIIYLIDVQKKINFPIFIFPQMIFWNMNPDRTKSIVASKATGDRGFISAWLTVMKSRTPAFVRLFQPINLQDEINKSGGSGSQEIAYAIREKILAVYDHNERVTLGPVIKSKQEMMEQVLYHQNVLNEISRISSEKNIPEKKLRNDAYKYYREIAADFSILTIKYFARSLDFVFEKIFDGIHYDINSMEKIREAAKKGPLVFMPSHRSHMDYLIVSYILYKNHIIPPHIAAGINLSFFGVGDLFRHSGAFFLRRSFKGLDLYPVVFKQYLKTLVAENYSIEFFIEGSRTRTGKLGFPKLGVLRYLIEAVEEGYNKDLIFIPVTVNYERILEENAYQQELQGAEKDTESLSAVVKARKFLKKKYGKVYLVFDEAVSFNDIKSRIADRNESVNAVAENIINKINEITVVTSISLASTTMLLLSDKGFSKNMVQDGFKDIFDYLSFAKVSMSDTLQSGGDLNQIIDEIIESFLNDNIIHELVINDRDEQVVVEDLYILREENRVKIRFYKNTIIQYLLPAALVSLSLVREMKSGKITKEALEHDYMFLKDLFSEEFIYSDDMKLNNNKCSMAYNYLVERSFISEIGNEIYVNKDRLNVIQLYSKILKSYIESYSIALSGLFDENFEKIQSTKLLTEIRKKGIKKYHLGEIQLIESLSTPSYQNAIKKFIKLGIAKETAINDRSSEIEMVDREMAEVLYNKIISFT